MRTARFEAFCNPGDRHDALLQEKAYRAVQPPVVVPGIAILIWAERFDLATQLVGLEGPFGEEKVDQCVGPRLPRLKGVRVPVDRAGVEAAKVVMPTRFHVVAVSVAPVMRPRECTPGPSM